MKILKLFAALIGGFAVIFNSSSCKKDEECCTWIDAFQTTYNYCEDDDDWKAYYNSWQDVKNEATSYGGNCD